MKVAIVYDRVNKWGGAERVLLALHAIFPDAPLFTSVYNPKTASWAQKFTVKSSFLQKWPFSQKHEFYAPLMPLAFESFSFDAYDVVISVTSEAAKGIITKPGTLHICVCLTPTRYLWSGYREYFSNRIFRVLSRPLVWYLRLWDRVAASRPDKFIAISHEVQNRIKKYYNRDSEVIFPPLTLAIASSEVMPEYVPEIAEIQDQYFLVVSRLSKFTAYKRVDLAIAAANRLQIPLVIVGDGDIAMYRKKAGKTVRFLGKISDAQLAFVYKNCKALIFPAKEDFGLAMIEAQWFGKPVIAYKAGGALDIVEDGKTGMFFNEQTRESLVEALEKFDETRYNSLYCSKQAKRFSFEVFKKAIKTKVEQVKKI